MRFKGANRISDPNQLTAVPLPSISTPQPSPRRRSLRSEAVRATAVRGPGLQDADVMIEKDVSHNERVEPRIPG